MTHDEMPAMRIQFPLQCRLVPHLVPQLRLKSFAAALANMIGALLLTLVTGAAQASSCLLYTSPSPRD